MFDKYKNLLWPGKFPDRQTTGLILTPVLIALILLLLDRYGLQGAFYRNFSELNIYQPLLPDQIKFAAQIHFSLSCLVMFIMVPLVFHVAFPLSGMDNYGLSLRAAVSHFPIYFVMLALMLPVLWMVSAEPEFYSFYPMYKPVGLSDWLLYESIYMLQFLTVEFFFRGFCLFRLERIAGQFSIALMVIPYALIHIHKPLPEALGSIGGGLILGYLALKTRSIWPGFFVHCGIAFSMDYFSLIRIGWIH